MEKLSGIYKITCLLNGVCYIGQSVDLTRRVRQHKTDLKNNRHHNKYLQNLFNKYKSDNFSFDVVYTTENAEKLDGFINALVEKIKALNKTEEY